MAVSNVKAFEFLYKDSDSIRFKLKDKELVLYVPEKYFERGLAEQVGDRITLLGVCDYTIQDLNTGENNGLNRLKFPSLFDTIPYSIEKVKDIKLKSYTPKMNYRVLRYRKDNVVISGFKVTQFIGNVEKFISLFFILGFIINTIPYDELHEYVQESANLNGFSYGLTAQMIGIILGEICRSNKDDNVPFRLSGSSDMHAYKSMSVRNISKHISPYTAIISEDFNESAMYAIMNETPKDTPLEKILVGE